MMNRILRTLPWFFLTACVLLADTPYNYIGARDVNYSLGNLSNPPKPLEPLSGDGIRLIWYEHWAPPDAVNIRDSLTDNFVNPFNNRAWGNIIIKFEIDRVVTDDANLDANGFLRDPHSLIAQGVISPTVVVEFEAIHFLHGNGIVKTWLGTNFVADYKLVSVNGRKYWLEPVTGPIGSWDYKLPVHQWRKIRLDIPIEMIKFPKKAALGSNPRAIENHLEVTTDYVGDDWAAPSMRVAWSKSTVKAMAPIVLVHGTNAKPDTWDVPGYGHSFNDYFSTFTGIYFNDIELTPNGPVDGNGTILKEQIANRLKSVGAKQCHIVAHSKGGNDSRSMIYQQYEGRDEVSDTHWNESLALPKHFEVLSLYTLETPHRGTVIADISWAVQNSGGEQVVADPNWQGLQNIINWDFQLAHQPWNFHPDGKAFAPNGHALENNTTVFMRNWNTGHHIEFVNANAGRPIRFYNTAADADWNIRNLKIDSTENKLIGDGILYGDGSQYPFDALNGVATSAYQMLYWAKEVQTRSSTRQVTQGSGEHSFTVTIPVSELFVPNGQGGREWNDLVVATSSAVYEGGTLFCPMSINNLGGILIGNHSGVKTKEMASEIVNQIRSDWTPQ